MTAAHSSATVSYPVPEPMRHPDFQLSEGDLAMWETDGYIIVRGMYDREEVRRIVDKFDRIAESGEPIPGYWNPDFESSDPLKRYPRVMHPHRWDLECRAKMLKPEVAVALRQLLREEPVACQLMYFYKAPGSPGQALHQDNFYLAVAPDTCVAAWTAMDPTVPENGGLYVVPGTHREDIQCPTQDELEKTKRTNLAEIPDGKKAVPVELNPGDTLFFNGSVIHGSGRNKTTDRWRRSFICHYMPQSSQKVNKAYFPIYDFEGREIEYEAAESGGPCGYKPGEGPAYNTYGTDAQF